MQFQYNFSINQILPYSKVEIFKIKRQLAFTEFSIHSTIRDTILHQRDYCINQQELHKNKKLTRFTTKQIKSSARKYLHYDHLFKIEKAIRKIKRHHNNTLSRLNMIRN